MSNEPPLARVASEVDIIKDAISKISDSDTKRAIKKFIGAAMGGIPWIPWFGNFLQALWELHDGKGQVKFNELTQAWLDIHDKKLLELFSDIATIVAKLERLDAKLLLKLESPEYLALVEKAFRTWDAAGMQEKRKMIRILLTNTAASQVSEDDLVRLFIEWMDKFHESHFKVLAVIQQKRQVTRQEIWQQIHGRVVRENSAEADLFKLLIHDLSLGHVIRQVREESSDGKYYKQKPTRKRSTSPFLKSAFDDEKEYELTELGSKFVHYAMTDVVTRIDNREATVTPPPAAAEEPLDDGGIS